MVPDEAYAAEMLPDSVEPEDGVKCNITDDRRFLGRSPTSFVRPILDRPEKPACA
ncbi:hypothetical protein JCM31598_29800 [Desulfonatronum parangueonense]